MEAGPFVTLLIAALAGGAFGAALGALPAFVFTGFVVLLGEGLAVLQSELGGGAVDVTGTVGFGAVVGPQVAFAGGVAATAYAGEKYPAMQPPDSDYHFGKEITYAFGTKPDVLAVGAAFGALGIVISRALGGIGAPTDGIAVSVVATALLARVAFGYPLVGSPGGEGLLDMSPFERAEKRTVTDGDVERERPVTEPWLPHQYEWPGVSTIGLVGGVLAGYLWLATGSVFMGYAISAVSLLFLQLGVERIPVTHHITLMGTAGAMVALPMVGGSDLIALVVAGGFGVLAALVGELSQRVLYAHSGTHVDPPAMAITAVMLLVGVLHLLGVLPNAAYLGI